MELGKKIKMLRYKAGLTQEQLAEKAGVSPQSVSKWENAVAMPDIAALPLLAEIFGVTIDDIFDLTTQQRLNRIENRLDAENELPQDICREYEDFLKAELADAQYRKRATELLAFLYWHQMNAYAQKVRRYAREAIRTAPEEKGCQWMLQMAEGHVAWDWNVSNHTAAIEFYKDLIKDGPQSELPYEYLLDNLIADRRADEAEEVLQKMSALKNSRPVIVQVYRAHIALARFNAPEADRMMEELTAAHPDDPVCLFEAAQYYAAKCDYEKAIAYYELSFEKTDRRPRFTDELAGIAAIHELRGDYLKAAQTYDRILELLHGEWGMTDEAAVKEAEAQKARLKEKAKE